MHGRKNESKTSLIDPTRIRGIKASLFVGYESFDITGKSPEYVSRLYANTVRDLNGERDDDLLMFIN